MVTIGPPAGPWELYATYLIFIPFILRIFVLGRPVYRAVHHLAPHAGWAVKKVQQIEVKGFHYIILNELFALIFPIALVVMVRLMAGPVGWSEWSEVSLVGSILLVLVLILWIVFDAIRLMPARRLFLLAGERDMNKVKLTIETIFAARGILSWFSGSRSLAATASSSDSQEGDEALGDASEAGDSDAESEADVPSRRSFKSTAKALLGQAAGKVLEAAKAGVQTMADKGKNLIDNQIKKQVNTLIEQMSKRKVPNLLRDVGMAVGPLVALWGIPHLMV